MKFNNANSGVVNLSRYLWAVKEKTIFIKANISSPFVKICRSFRKLKKEEENAMSYGTELWLRTNKKKAFLF